MENDLLTSERHVLCHLSVLTEYRENPKLADASYGVGRFSVKRGDLVRLLLQQLHSLGYSESAGVLEKESGVMYQSESARSFRELVVSGAWDAVCAGWKAFVSHDR